ncbi:hypothetical protein [Chondromyces apiculatus]|uniref:Lipoprotein n=1 Tax=Chondromyces apiculatus DSM 436 TaxID=1192034 RepID=A0A017T5M6_9BACT|nr:hypothetical protein [Chondromyces apiculatus]EYF04090.1 Hypothetical protein CAP_4773 [Chondromyces apiculatus DSM 436]
MRLPRPLRWSLAATLVALAAACGARSSLFIDERAAGGGGGAPLEDAGADVRDAGDASDAEPDVYVADCVEAGVTYIYLVSQEYNLYSFNPGDGSLVLRGSLDCPTTARPFSMGVDRRGTAYVVYDDGQLYKVSTLDASCEPTPFVPEQHGFRVFGMGFSTNEGGPDETLYVAEINFNGPSLGLATIDTDSFELSPVGPFSENPGTKVEMTGTGDGHLYGYFMGDSPGGFVVEIDKQNATILSSTPLPTGSADNALAFAFWGGDFYIFTSQGGGITVVTRYRPSDGSVEELPSLGATIVGAGVSTCAPQ